MRYRMDKTKRHIKNKMVFCTLCIVFTILVGNVFGSEILYFIYGQPGTDMSNKLPFPMVLFKYDIYSGAIEEIWSSEKNVRTINLINLSELNKIIFLEDYSKFRIFEYDDIPNNIYIDLEHLGPLNSRFYYVQNIQESDEIITLKINKNKENYPAAAFEFINVAIEDGKVIDNIAVTKSFNNLRLAGAISPYGNGTSNVLSVNVDSKGSMTPIGLNVNLTDISIPDDLIYFDSSLGWTIIANESRFFGLISAPHRHELTQRELLIFNKITNEWHSILMEGSETIPVIINNWLVGVIAHTDPETNFETRKGFPPILSEKSILINPMENRQFTVHLGKNSEILWIDDDTVYYRIEDALYKARIENYSLIEQQLLLTDERVRHFHWAFSGKSPEQIKHKNIE